ncbi:MAG: lysophospholipid acyltransferase family protein, partial [Acidimicrobiales bacterium]
NHRSYFDVVALGLTVLAAGRPLRFMAKKEVFDAPVIGWLARAMGGIMVDRGSASGSGSTSGSDSGSTSGSTSGSDSPLAQATQALEAGELVAVLPQGTIPRGPAFFDPVLKAKTGAARLARATGAPVVPVGLWGTEAVWPRSARLPRLTNLTDPPTVRTRVGRPLRFAPDSEADVVADSERIMAAIVAQLPAQARRSTTPSAEDLAATMPPGLRGK